LGPACGQRRHVSLLANQNVELFKEFSFMRSVLARLALTGLVGFALAGCSTSGASLPTGAIPNGDGGGSVPVSTQNPPGTSIPDVLIDGGVLSATDTYTGVNNTATDAQSATDAGTDPKTGGSGAPPADPAGSHSITFTGSGAAQVIFKYAGTVPALYYNGGIYGQIQPADFGAIVLYASIAAATPAPATGAPKIAIELVGGSNYTSYDVRSTCGPLKDKGAAPGGTLARYVCALPAYGSISGTTGSVTLTAASGATAAVTTSYVVDTDIANPRTADTTGTFVPNAATLYVELIYGGPTSTASTGNVLNLDYLYAEAGTK
jgi:hypothetical protein